MTVTSGNHSGEVMHGFLTDLNIRQITFATDRPTPSSQMDPLASRLTHNVPEYSAPQGSSSFSHGHTGMDTNRILFRLKQGQRSLEQNISEFLAISNYSDLPDCIIIEIFCDGVNEPLKVRLRREGLRSSLAAFMDFALMCVGSSFTVGVAEEQRDIAVTSAVQPARIKQSSVMSLLPYHSQTKLQLRFLNQVKFPSPVKLQLHFLSQVKWQLRFLSQVKSQLLQQNRPGSRHVSSGRPESSHDSSDRPEPRHASADSPESLHVSSDRPKPRHVLSHTIMMASVLDPPLVSVRAANLPVASAPSKPTSKETLPPAAALPLMAVAIWCVWAAHCAPEVTSVHKPAPEVTTVHKSAPEVTSVHKTAPEVTSVHKSAPEVTSVHKSAPEVTSVHKSAPEVTSDHRPAPELPSDHKPAPELPSDHRPAPELPSDHKSALEASFAGETAQMPPEVSAPAVEPLMETALTCTLSTSLLTLSASSVPALPRSRSMTRVPALPRWAPAPPALPWRATAPPALPPAPPWWAPAPPALPQRAPAPPAPPWRAPAPPPALPWRAPAPPAPPPAPPWRAPAPPAPPWKASASPGPPTAPQDCFSVGASGELLLWGGYVTNLVGHHQMSLSPYPHTLTVVLHPGLHLPVSITLIASAPVTNQARYKSPRLSF
ncbi:Filamentous hemagglutinin [Labeo rohita]|uniref:Filamentous hemagglutinin n=1 Tax=Labeo rohita TaxID=84645 RepID=A0ABQ8L3B8_LABRO|nr:Filamentous hemagglutinin [Labeo rohita]